MATAHAAYAPLRLALAALVAVLSAVTLFGRLPLGLGPVAGSVTARIVRMVGTTLAVVGAAGVVLGFGAHHGATLTAPYPFPVGAEDSDTARLPVGAAVTRMRDMADAVIPPDPHRPRRKSIMIDLTTITCKMPRIVRSCGAGAGIQ